MSGSSREVREYASTLVDLTCNSKPMINVLTMLASENVAHAAEIVATIESHLEKVPKDIKLPVMYLIDCIMKTVGGTYLTLFSQNIVTTFCHVFEVVDEKTRSEMFKLRQTWNDVLPKTKLFSLDVKVSQLDPAWPISEPPVANNIHLNPKFLQNMTLPKKSPPIDSPAASEVGLSTLDMQKQLIMKQQQLLELQQKRLELEVLQTRVKLQEKIGMGTGTEMGTKINKNQNILLKPEVAKQLASGGNNNSKNSKQLNSSSLMNKRLPQSAGNGGLTNVQAPKIAPVNSALVAAASGVRATRDPRLARLQSGATTNSNNNNNSTTTFSSNVPLENKSNITAETLGSNANRNKSLNNNKASVEGNSRSDPRSQVSSKPPISTSSAQPPKSKTPAHSPTKKSDLFSAKAVRPGRVESKPTNVSPPKSKGGKTGRSSSASPTKHKKKEKPSSSTSSKTLPSSAPTSSSSSSSSLSSLNLGKADKEGKTLSPGKPTQSDALPATFKELKGSSKSRNYVRRNRELSVSPEPVTRDVDLRLSGPPEKQPRLQSDNVNEDNGSTDDLAIDGVTGMDVDLRQLPSIVSKKRSSTSPEPNVSAKKTKTEVFDELFGNEDTDLRQLTTVISQDRPPTPPPPIISSKPQEEKSEKVKNLDILRAKLANATNRDKMRSKLDQKQKDIDLRNTDLRNTDLRNTDLRNTDLRNPDLRNTDLRNTDLRNPDLRNADLRNTDLRNTDSRNTDSRNPDDSVNKIIISSADEQCIKTGNMTKEQEKALMNKILAQMENQKLNEAKRKDNEENLGNISLQPISDDELEANFSGSSDEETAEFRRNIYVDKDDRLPIQNEFNKFPRAPDRGDLRRGMWRGRPIRGRGMIRGGIRPPMRPENWRLNGPWKPMQSNFIKPIYNNEVIDLDNIDQEQNENQPQELVVDCVNQDNTKSINIDGFPRDIRYYDETAIIFMSWDDPREISFQNGSRKIIFGDKDVYFLSFNEPYKEVLINGSPHNVKLGAPTREIYVDGKYYECFFGGPQVFIDLDGKITSLKMEGPPPQVKIGTIVRKDLVAGQINLIIDAKTVVPVFLDGRVQKFEIEGKVNTLKFIDALKTVLINDVAFNVEYGGLPKPIIVQDKKHFIRFTRLPRGVRPGFVKIKDMEGNCPESPRVDSENSLDAFPNVGTNEPVLPVVSKKRKVLGIESPERNSNSPVPSLFQQAGIPGLNNLDSVLSSVMASNLLPTHPNISTNNNGYQVENQPKEVPQQDQQPQQDVQNVEKPPIKQTTTNPTPLIPSTLNINDLFQKLVASGIMTTLQEQKTVTSEASVSTNLSQSVPSQSNLSQSNPIQTNFSQSNPIQSNFSQSNPIQSNLSLNNPIQSNLSLNNPIQSNLSQNNPIQNPPQTNLIPPNLIQSNLIQSNQIQTNPISNLIQSNLTQTNLTQSNLIPSNSIPPNLKFDGISSNQQNTNIINKSLPNNVIKPPINQMNQMNQKFPMILRKEMPLFYKSVSFDKPETLKPRQPGLINSLYSGMPCSSCGMRFPPEQSMQYSQHLDWHFRQNRKGKKNIRKAASRKWYYSLSDWKNYEEIEDLEEREKSYFENQQQAQAEGSEEIEEEVEIPSVPADPNVQDPRCEVCHDRFDQFYNEDKEEWHLKQAICVDGLNYHPLCYEDYRTSLVETTLDESVIEKDDENTQDSIIPGLDVVQEENEIVIDDDESEKLDFGNKNENNDSKNENENKNQSENENKDVKMKENDESQNAFDDDDDDDVIINEIIPEKIDLVDDDRYDDLPDEKHEPRVIQIKEEPIDDGFVDVDGGIFKVQDITNVKIKSEPIDPDELEADELLPSGVETSNEMEKETESHPSTDLVTHMDGNVEFDSTVQPTSGISGKIKINITKPLPVIAPKDLSSTNKELSSEIERGGESIDPSQPLPPGEEPVQLNVKPALRGVDLKKLPPVKKGSELSGLCSIM